MIRLATMVIASLLLAACSRTGPLTLAATFPPSSDGLIDAMAVSVIDQTGLVTGMAPAPPGTAGPRVIVEPGESNALRIEWLGSDCDGRMTLVLNPSADGYEVAIHIDPTPAGGFGCQQLDVPRAVTLRLKAPIAPERVTINEAYP